MEGVGAQIAIRPLRSRAERLIVVAQLLEHARTFVHQSFFEVIEHFLAHCLRLFPANGCCHVRYRTLSMATATTRPSMSSACVALVPSLTPLFSTCSANTSSAIHFSNALTAPRIS